MGSKVKHKNIRGGRARAHPHTHTHRYCQLEDPMARRHQQLEDSLKLHQLQQDIEDEMNWIRERTPLASCADLGNTLSDVQSLQKKHSVLETDLSSHSTAIEAVTNTAQELMTAQHYASREIEEERGNLLESWAELQDMVDRRSKMLNDSLQVQQVTHVVRFMCA